VNAQQLEEGILDLEAWKAGIFVDWPAPDKKPSSLNRQAIAEAREALARGERGWRREDLIWGGNQFFLKLPADPQRSVIEFQGEVLACVVPPPKPTNGSAAQSVAWSDSSCCRSGTLSTADGFSGRPT
jgi:hypothetical protein